MEGVAHARVADRNVSDGRRDLMDRRAQREESEATGRRRVPCAEDRVARRNAGGAISRRRGRRSYWQDVSSGPAVNRPSPSRLLAHRCGFFAGRSRPASTFAATGTSTRTLDSLRAPLGEQVNESWGQSGENLLV